MTDQLLNAIRAKFPLHEIDAGSFSKLKAKGMKFDVHAYEAKGLGHVSVMRASGMLGMMKMDTLIINPTALDLPLYSYDRILAMGNDTLIIELYDTTVEPLKYDALEAVNAANRSLPERDPGMTVTDLPSFANNIPFSGGFLFIVFLRPASVLRSLRAQRRR